ncbi:MAG: sulfur carrier protein ThiS [Burkholderiales bacterium]|nr:sulfur carrier protein ThiS [Polynucleobacter sp.]MCX7245932.1 sulfur carrier protein ThiS [Burkholderiales bacterium]
MRIVVNHIPRDLPTLSKVSDLLQFISAKPPYAVAVNLQFIPKTQHSIHILEENDQVEVIAPVTGG